MKRREFIKKAGLVTAGAVAAPYIIPSGRLFAASGAQIAEHVVFVAFAGGVRQQESVLQRYIDDSQGQGIPGNIMYNMLDGAAPTQKIVYGTSGSLAGDTPIPRILSQTIQQQGVLFPEANSSVVGHYSGLNALVTGNYAATQGLRQKPLNPTIFEYARRHLGLSATKTWFIGNTIGNSVPLLNYSLADGYGSAYGANFLAPNLLFGNSGQQHLEDAKVYHPDEELSPMYKMKLFLDSAAFGQGQDVGGIKNTDAEKNDLKEFFRATFAKVHAGSIAFPPVTDNGDTATIGYACEVMKWFKPAVTVVNMSSVDGCHSNFTGYLRSLHRADHGVAHLWNYIQTQIPEMANNTVMVVIPECGRNLNPNPIIDENDWFAFDHSDANARRVFSMMVGPTVPGNLQVGSTSNPVGDVTDGVVTMADVLGIKSEVVNSGYLHANARSLFDRI